MLNIKRKFQHNGPNLTSDHLIQTHVIPRPRQGEAKARENAVYFGRLHFADPSKLAQLHENDFALVETHRNLLKPLTTKNDFSSK